MSLKIADDAIFIADAHFHDVRLDILTFLDNIKNSKIKTSQLFLVGDIADILIGEIDFFIQKNRIFLEKLNDLANFIEIIYLEGNHDFNLKKLLNPKIKLYSLKQQPLIMEYNNKKVAISHGDIYGRLKYRIFTTILRNRVFLMTINFIDKKFDNLITKKVWNWLIYKKLDTIHYNLKNMINRKIDNYYKLNIDIVIEGHYHQNKELTFDNLRYINIPSFALEYPTKVGLFRIS